VTTPGLQILAQVFSERLLNTAAVGVVLAVLVCALLRVIGRQNSGTRFAVWFSALLAIVALPFISGSSFLASHLRQLPPTNSHGQLVLSSSWAFCLFAVWGAGAGLLLLRLILGMWRVRHLRRNCEEVAHAAVDPAIAAILQDFATRRRVKLCVSRDVTVPAAIGFFQPAIVFPAALLPQLSAKEIELVVLHELAHLRRWDDWTNLAQKIVKAIFFFHPAVWWIENRLTLEREMACDDIVLAQTASPRAYASSLISFAEKMHNARGLALAQALVSRMHQMSLRVAQILDAKRPSRTRLWKPVLALSAGMLTMVLGAAPYVPKFVAFQDAPGTARPQRIETADRGSVNQSSSNDVAPAVRAGLAGTRTQATNIAQRRLQIQAAPQPKVIPAAFHPRSSAVPLRLKASSPRQPRIIRAAEQQEPPFQPTILILQTTRYETSGAPGSAVWTFCIWRVGGKNLSERQLESAIVLSSI
jgi:beta-lactamase regulating signal transducer with metallopeptidase domain